MVIDRTHGDVDAWTERIVEVHWCEESKTKSRRPGEGQSFSSEKDGLILAHGRRSELRERLLEVWEVDAAQAVSCARKSKGKHVCVCVCSEVYYTSWDPIKVHFGGARVVFLSEQAIFLGLHPLLLKGLLAFPSVSLFECEGCCMCLHGGNSSFSTFWILISCDSRV